MQDNIKIVYVHIIIVKNISRDFATGFSDLT